MPSTRSGASYKPSSSSQKGHRHYYGRSQSNTEGQGSVKDFHNNKLPNFEADDTILLSKRSDTATRSLSGHLKSQPEGVQECTAAQRVPDPCRSVEKLHEFIPDCKKIAGSSQHLQVTQWISSIDGKEQYDAFNSRMEETQPSTTKASARPAPVASSSNSNMKKQPQAQNKGKGKAPGPKPCSQVYRIPKIQQYSMENVFQMARTIMELQKKEEARLIFQKLFLTYLIPSPSFMKL
ncbi:hypothetical protein O181_092184 [Austropuccinia psidii MF-1]|uniref:Uncharacterized protein n=1 Tax=Austropuccinia psidii MF-1 TaxID=1389203 RepID=A0A9Q3P8L6_9BASI|nr:hypothetical protein [Austropuccinia psidii MF-1]